VYSSLPTDSNEMENKLISDTDEILDSEFPLDKLPLVIGRSPEAAIRVRDRWVSRRNCEIVSIDGSLVIRDLGSKNGTLVNGQHVREASLTPGDRLTVGMTTFIVSGDGDDLESNAGEPTLILGDAASEADRIIEEISRQKPRRSEVHIRLKEMGTGFCNREPRR
jgi:pSer/pThr/pTyr-binding forkhead associated (FHA) protein